MKQTHKIAFLGAFAGSTIEILEFFLIVLEVITSLSFHCVIFFYTEEINHMDVNYLLSSMLMLCLFIQIYVNNTEECYNSCKHNFELYSIIYMVKL